MIKKIKICEIFHSIQGEGVNAGVPAVFVRFFGCNLQCTWCDTKQSWHPDHADSEAMDIDQIVEKIQSYKCPHIVFTGGEPSLFQKEIKLIINKLKENPPSIDYGLSTMDCFSFELETNGSMPIEDDIWHTINISPKLENSGNPPYEIKAAQFPKKNWWKFVVEGERSMPEILETQKKYAIPNNRIILMPQAQTKKELESKSPTIQKLCNKYGFRFGPRLHIELGVR